ncbi:HTH deoR-type domain-containing protein [Bordetella sputigena]|uniref:DeoR/GlpR family DNA-binding transcription regulator n=1 Tax=Bordetella sputigena TaxID=1416810 RepID=UPI0039EE7433
MLQEERIARIQALLGAFTRVSTERLARELSVSRETVRRDVLELEAQGALRRVHGGVVTTAAHAEPPYAQRQHLRAREKRAIARAVLPMLAPGQVILLDAGTTTGYLAEALRGLSGLTVITNSLGVAMTLARRDEAGEASRHEVILLGGTPHGDVPATYGSSTINEIGRYHADLALLSPVGLSAKHGATSYAHHEAEVAQAMAMQASQRVLLADYSKIGLVSRVRYAKSQDVSRIVTNAHDDAGVQEELRRWRRVGVEVVLA